jgi:hypothetical protein
MQQQETVTITMSVVTECVYWDRFILEISWSLWGSPRVPVPQCSWPAGSILFLLATKVASSKSRFVKLEPNGGIEPIFSIKLGLLLGAIILKEPGMEFLIEELSVCNTVTNSGCTLERRTKPTVAPQQTLTLLK